LFGLEELVPRRPENALAGVSGKENITLPAIGPQEKAKPLKTAEVNLKRKRAIAFSLVPI
jgi:hypothetical protein